MGESNKTIKLGGVAWIRLAQYRDLWQAVVSTVIKVWVTKLQGILDKKINCNMLKKDFIPWRQPVTK